MFFHAEPMAVLGTITLVVVDSVDGAFTLRRVFFVAVGICPLAESKIVLPFRANADATAAVVAVPHVRRILTPLLHVVPDMVQPFTRMAFPISIALFA